MSWKHTYDNDIDDFKGGKCRCASVVWIWQLDLLRGAVWHYHGNDSVLPLWGKMNIYWFHDDVDSVITFSPD